MININDINDSHGKIFGIKITHKHWFFYFEGMTFLLCIGFGLAIYLERPFYFLFFGICFIIFYGILTLYISKYKLRPFFYNELPKSIKRWYEWK